MLPAIIAGSVLAKTPIVGTLLRMGFFVFIAIGTFLIARKVVNMIRRDKAVSTYSDTNTIDGKATQYANQLYQAMIRSNAFWNSWFGDGTDTSAIYSTAAEMHQNGVSFAAVSKKFKALFNKDLLQTLNSDLSSQEILRFNQILSSGLSGFRIQTLLKTTQPTIVLDENFNSLLQVFPSTELGMHLESVFAGNKRYDGFEHNGRMRYVDGDSVAWINQ